MRPSAFAYKRQAHILHRKGPQWGRALRVRKTTHMVTMPMLCFGRKFVGHATNSHGATARALGHAGSLQRVRPALFNFARRHSEGALTRNPRRGFVGHITNSHGATARALGHAGSLQRVRRALFKFAQRHSEGALTRAILAEGWLGTLRIRAAPQRERFEARDPSRGFIGHCTHAQNVKKKTGRTLTTSRMNTPHTANTDAGSYTHFEKGNFQGVQKGALYT